MQPEQSEFKKAEHDEDEKLMMDAEIQVDFSVLYNNYLLLFFTSKLQS